MIQVRYTIRESGIHVVAQSPSTAVKAHEKHQGIKKVYSMVRMGTLSPKNLDDPANDAELLMRIEDNPGEFVRLSVVMYCADRMSICVRKHQIKREIECSLFGAVDETGPSEDWIPKHNMNPEGFEKIRTAARALMRQRSIVSEATAKEDSISFWEHCLTNPDVPWAVKARAQENLDVIKRVRPNAASGNGQQVNVAVQQTVTLADLNLDLAGRKQALAAIRTKKQADATADATAHATLNCPID